MKQFNTKMRKKRKEKGLKIVELAAMVDVTKAVVGYHDRHGIKTVRVAKRYAAVLDCEPVDLLDI